MYADFGFFVILFIRRCIVVLHPPHSLYSSFSLFAFLFSFFFRFRWLCGTQRNTILLFDFTKVDTVGTKSEWAHERKKRSRRYPSGADYNVKFLRVMKKRQESNGEMPIYRFIRCFVRVCVCVYVVCETGMYNSPTYWRGYADAKNNQRSHSFRAKNVRCSRIDSHSNFFHLHLKDGSWQSQCHFHYSRVRNDTYAIRQRTYTNSDDNDDDNGGEATLMLDMKWNESQKHFFFLDDCMLCSHTHTSIRHTRAKHRPYSV